MDSSRPKDWNNYCKIYRLQGFKISSVFTRPQYYFLIMKLLCLCIFLGSVLSTAINFAEWNANINFTDLIADFELNIVLVSHVMNIPTKKKQPRTVDES